MGADWIVTQLSSREHYAVARTFLRRGKLHRLYTDAWCSVGRGLLRRGPAALRSLAGRYHPEIPSSRVTSYTFRALRDSLRQPKNQGIEETNLQYIRIG